jgi:hypothetical protein
MLVRTLLMGATAITVVASAAMGASLSERLHADRHTVLNVDQASGRFQCAEHRCWIQVARDSLAAAQPGDIVRLERVAAHPVRLVVLRTAAEELASPEQ